MPKPNPGKAPDARRKSLPAPAAPDDTAPIPEASAPVQRIDPSDLHCVTDASPPRPRPPLPPGDPADAEARQRILEDLDTNLLVEAAAGSGKTTSLVGRLTALLASGRATMEGLVAMTFTRKAAAELRGRFQAQVDESARREDDPIRRERLQRAAQEIDRAYLGTVHAFCAKLLRERPVEAGVDIGFREIDEAEEALSRQRAWDHFVATFPRRQPGLFRQVTSLGLTLPDLRATYDRLVEYADVDDWPAPETPRPDATALRRAIDVYLDHCRHLQRDLPDEPRDWLMRKIRALPRLFQIMEPRELPDLMAFVDAFDRPATKKDITQKHWPGPRAGARGSVWAQRELERWNELWANVFSPARQQWRACRYPAALAVARAAAEEYARARRLTGVLSYQDLLLGAVRLLRGHPAVRRYFQERYTHVLVDEFQDTDPLQAELMVLLTAPAGGQVAWPLARPDPGRLFVVGDPQQSIYRFRRADISTYELLKQCLVNAGGAVVALTTNFRTVPELVEWANRHFETRFPSDATAEAPAHRPLQPGRLANTDGDLCGIRTLPIPDKVANNRDEIVGYEADWIARTLRHWLDTQRTVPRTPKETSLGKPPFLTPDDVLIVTWRKRNLSRFGHALDRVGIPYQITGGTTLNELPELAMLIQALRVALRPDDAVAVLSYLRGPAASFSDQDLFAYHQAGGGWHGLARVPGSLPAELRERLRCHFGRLRRWFRQARRLPAVAMLETLATDLALDHVARLLSHRPQALGHLAKLFDLARQADRDLAGLSDHLAYLERLQRGDPAQDGFTPPRGTDPAVRIMNLHKVKGLEAPVVFLADATGEVDVSAEFHLDRTGAAAQGYLTIRKPTAFGASTVLAEPKDWTHWAGREEAFLQAERERLRYVAATRAGCLLVISQCMSDGSPSKNPWADFAAALADVAPLPTPPEPSPPPSPPPLPLTGLATPSELALAWQNIMGIRPSPPSGDDVLGDDRSE